MREAAVATDRTAFRAAVADAPAETRGVVEARLAVDDPFDATGAESDGDPDAIFDGGRERALAGAIPAVFPGGTITGAPKPRTMALVDDVEAARRGPHAGSLAAVGFDGDATLDIVVRTPVRHADEYHLRVGAGVVQDSDPGREYDDVVVRHRERPHVGAQFHPETESIHTPTGNQFVSNFLDTCAIT